MPLKLITHASEILTGAGVRGRDGRRPQESDLGRILDGALVYQTKRVGRREIPDKLVWVGPTSEIPKKYLKLPKRSLKGLQAIIPGMVDCHTHLVFAGDRSEEFALRCGGMSYQEIATGGGGILTSVLATRSASIDELEALAVPRVEEARSYGVRTIEIKSGYGLSFESELKVLEVVPRLRKKFPDMTLVATFLGAHGFPKEMSREAYLTELTDRMLPEVARKRLASACDVFIDEGYFTVSEATSLLAQARKLGLRVKVHADELGNTGSAAFAAGIGALSADHLLCVSEEGVSALAKSDTVAVLLPGTAFYLKAEHAPARALIDAGACVALSTDFNPGTCMTVNLPAILTIAALYLRMSRAEIFAAVTYNAAKALGLQESKGTLEAGKDADFSILPFKRFEELYYRFAWSPR